MAKRPTSPRNPTVLSQPELAAHRIGLPKSRHGHSFAPDRVPSAFHTVVDPDKNPPQPWRDLPVPPGLPPYRMSLDTILDPATLKSIEDSGKFVFHSVGDTGGVNTPTYIEGVSRFMECDIAYTNPPDRSSLFYHLGDVVYYPISTITPRLSPSRAIMMVMSIRQRARRACRPSFATFVLNQRSSVLTIAMPLDVR
jgi:hypothetical protein